MLFRKEVSSPVGRLTILASDNSVHAVLFGQLNGQHKDSKNHPILLQCEQELDEYFKSQRSDFTVPLKPTGTEFQKKVWSTLTQIPFGQTISYSEQAIKMGNKKSVRAVAAANGRNPIAIIIPCHRVGAAIGHLHGYAGGLDLKKKLLQLEGLRIKNLQVLKDKKKYTESITLFSPQWQA